jgi:hypothetical protein
MKGGHLTEQLLRRALSSCWEGDLASLAGPLGSPCGQRIEGRRPASPT